MASHKAGRPNSTRSTTRVNFANRWLLEAAWTGESGIAPNRGNCA